MGPNRQGGPRNNPAAIKKSGDKTAKRPLMSGLSAKARARDRERDRGQSKRVVGGEWYPTNPAGLANNHRGGEATGGVYFHAKAQGVGVYQEIIWREGWTPATRARASASCSRCRCVSHTLLVSIVELRRHHGVAHPGYHVHRLGRLLDNPRVLNETTERRALFWIPFQT